MWGAPRASDRNIVRRAAETHGRGSEFWAALWFCCRFYRVLGRRVKTRLGELAILCFIEVKAWALEGTAAESITGRQRSRIVRAAALYLGAHPALRHKAVRFDAILVTPRRWPRHLKDVWRPDSSWVPHFWGHGAVW